MRNIVMEDYKEIEIDLSTMGNLNAILMHKEVPVLRFSYKGGVLQMLQVSIIGGQLTPESIIKSEDKHMALIEFLLRRICLNITINGSEFKEGDTILFPHMQRYLSYTYGQSIFDEYWLDCMYDKGCWNETLFEFTQFPRKKWKELPRYKKRKEIDKYVLNMVK